MAGTTYNCDVLVAGEYYCDLVFAGLDDAPGLGKEQFASGLSILPGGTYNMASGLTRLQIETRWACDFGTDLFSTFVLAQAKRDGINPVAFSRHDRPLSRLSAAFTKGSERGFISYCDPPVAPPPGDVAAKFSPRWLLQTFRFEPEWLAFITTKRAAGAQVFADCRSGHFTLETPGVREFLANVDVFSPNAEEACSLTGESDCARALERLRTEARTVVLKNGPDGALLATRDQVLHIPGMAVDVIDTVGAGDAFNAGYLFGCLHGLEPALCAQAGNLCGAYSVTVTGGSASPKKQDLAVFAQTRGLRLDSRIMEALSSGKRHAEHSNKNTYPKEG